MNGPFADLAICARASRIVVVLECFHREREARRAIVRRRGNDLMRKRAALVDIAGDRRDREMRDREGRGLCGSSSRLCAIKSRGVPTDRAGSPRSAPRDRCRSDRLRVLSRGAALRIALLSAAQDDERPGKRGRTAHETVRNALRLSHVRIVRPAAALRRDPVDVLRRILDVAGFAVDAVLRVDLEPRTRWLPRRPRKRPPGNNAAPARR